MNEYIRYLFSDKREERIDIQIDEGPDIMNEEIEALKFMKKAKQMVKTESQQKCWRHLVKLV